MTTGHSFIATSLDGFVARPNHALDWLMKHSTEGEDHGYAAFMAGVDGLVMGRGSFKTLLTFDAWPYQKPVVVMSHSLTPADVPDALQNKVQITQLGPKALMAQLHTQGWQQAYIDGGLVIQSFIRLGLIADITLTTIPILIGEGIRLFGMVDQDIDLKLIQSRSFASGLVQNHYQFCQPTHGEA
ncbi:dihydrofolate reductase family protein [Magnetococcus sp. PR-3]|uniref:dihydrofolate reductase family protein n=1 Tax=Magnetococcus sp. PR-3 TaxID=3120355 RepID=UPI002FCDFD39